MPLHLDPDSGIPLYLQLVDGLIEGIATGELGEGEEVSSSRSLAAEERVNYHTVNKAYGILEQEGFYVRQRGGAYRVAPGVRPLAAGRLLSEDLERLCRRARALGLTREALCEALLRTFDATPKERP